MGRAVWWGNKLHCSTRGTWATKHHRPTESWGRKGGQKWRHRPDNKIHRACRGSTEGQPPAPQAALVTPLLRGAAPLNRAPSARDAQARWGPPRRRRLRSEAGARRARKPWGSHTGGRRRCCRCEGPSRPRHKDEGGCGGGSSGPPPPGTTWRRSCGRAWRRPRGAKWGPAPPRSLLVPLPSGTSRRSGAGPRAPCCPRSAALRAARFVPVPAALRASWPRFFSWRRWGAAAPRCPRAVSTTGAPKAPAKRQLAARWRWRWCAATWSSLTSCLPRHCPTGRLRCEYGPGGGDFGVGGQRFVERCAGGGAGGCVVWSRPTVHRPCAPS